MKPKEFPDHIQELAERAISWKERIDLIEAEEDPTIREALRNSLLEEMLYEPPVGWVGDPKEYVDRINELRKE